MRRHLRSAIAFLALGVATTLGVAWLMTLAVDVQAGTQTQAERYSDDEQWSVTRWDKAGAIQVKSVRIKGLNWSPQQAAGAPDTRAQGDQVTAWASRSPDLGTEWLELEYARAVQVREVRVYESDCPGALFKVTAFDAGGREVEAWSGTDPTPASAAANGSPVPISTIPVSLGFAVSRIRIYLAADKVPGWNEIDAVGLVSDAGDVQWARHVQASSTYASASGTASGGNPGMLVPSWTRLDRPGRPWESGIANREERMVDARGWPMVALMSETDNLASSGSVNGQQQQQLLQLQSYNSYSSPTSGLSRGTVALGTPSAGRVPTPLPIRPIWAGLVGDSLLYGLAWFVIWSALTVPRRFITEVARCRRGACIQCGYDLGFDFINGCSECGWRRDRAAMAPPRLAATQSANGD